MKQEDLNIQYVLSNQNLQLYRNIYCNYDLTQNYSQNFSYFSQTQLLPYCAQWPYTHFYPSFPAANTPSAPVHSSYTPPHFPADSSHSSLQHQSKNNTVLPVSALRQTNTEAKVEQQRKIQRKINRIKHINEVNKNRVLKKGKKNFTSYYWSSEENKRYFQFLKLHPGLFDLSVSEKKNLRVNVMMSKKVKTRSPQQCHSHHQKMIKKFGSISGIISGMGPERSRALEDKVEEWDQVKDQVKLENTIADQ